MKILFATLLTFLLLAQPIKAGQPQHVLVEWIDIIALDGGWHSVEEIDYWIETEPCTVTQAGFIYKETPEYLVIIDSYFTGDLKGNALKIPKGCIVKVKNL